MGTRDPRVDAYIRQAAPFARPILEHIRELVHAACPAVTEELKWKSPHFGYKGMLCGMAAFKQHAAFGFWKHELLLDPNDAKWKEAMGSFGCLKTIDDLPSKAVLTKLVKRAMKLNDEGVKVVRTKTGPRKAIPTPPELQAALAKNAKARKAYAAFAPSHQREYNEWIAEAKRDETRAKRVATAVEWLSAGKQRNWKYQNC
jgi:uncharacterized protein YdeI (YjbR/CyaY-like superfamily)